MASKGDWVKVHQVVLKAGERAPQVPDDTKAVPLEMWVKGTLLGDARVGDTVQVRTRTGRVVEGTLTDDTTGYFHTFGDDVPELRQVGEMLRRRMRGEHHAG